MKKHWYIVANRAGARVFEQHGLEATARRIDLLENPEGRLMVREIVSDQPGLAEASKLYGGSAMGNEQGPKRRIEDAFAHKIADYLDNHAHRGDFDSAVLIAEHHILGRIRSLLGAPSIHKVRTSLAKDYGYMTDPEVVERLRPLLTSREDVRPSA